MTTATGAAGLKAVATGQVQTRPKTILDFLEDKRVHAGIAAVAGKFMSPDRMLRLCVNAVKKTPKLIECDPQTVLGAMMTSAALGLEPNTVQQQAFLIPYKRRAKVGNNWVDVFDCQFQIGARGFVTLAYRSPHIKSLTAEAIHEGDTFEHQLGSSAFLRYSKALANRGALIGAFSYVGLREGGESAFVLPLDEIEKIRGKSETFRSLLRAIETAEDQKARARAEQNLAETPWIMWADDMAAKSAIKKHAKQLPIASGDALMAAAEIDNTGDASVLDLRSMADPDVARSVIDEGAEPPAIEHQPAETMDFGGREDAERERVPRGQSPAARPAAPPPATPAARTPATPTRRQAGPPQFDEAAFEKRLRDCKDRDTLAVLGDELRSVENEDARIRLGAIWEKRDADLGTR